MATREERRPEPGTRVCFCLVGDGIHVECAPAIVEAIEGGGELRPDEALHPGEALLPDGGPRLHMVRLAIVTRHGGGVIAGIGYAALAARDFSGTYHYADEHGAGRAVVPFSVPASVCSDATPCDASTLAG